jgi:hypothetical protein
LPLNAEEIDDWQKTRTYGKTNYVLGVYGRGLIACALVLTLYATQKFIVGAPVSELLKPKFIVGVILFTFLILVNASENWNLNEKKITESQALAAEI